MDTSAVPRLTYIPGNRKRMAIDFRPHCNKFQMLFLLRILADQPRKLNKISAKTSVSNFSIISKKELATDPTQYRAYHYHRKRALIAFCISMIMCPVFFLKSIR